MSIRLWPQDFERKDHITTAEKALLGYASRNFQNGHMVIGIDPVGLSTDKVRMGMYISPDEGLATFSIYTGNINALLIPHYIFGDLSSRRYVRCQKRGRQTRGIFD